MKRRFNTETGVWDNISGGIKQETTYKVSENKKRPHTSNWKRVVKKNGKKV